MKLRLLLLAILTLSSCIPYPHFNIRTEKQSGTLLFQGKPLKDIKILQSFSFMDRKCVDAQVETHTDNKGYFEFPANSTFDLASSLGENHYFSNLCALYKDQVHWILFTHTVQRAEREESKFICELEVKKPEKSEKSEKPVQLGKNVRPESLPFACAPVKE